jgi:hypothetical protein
LECNFDLDGDIFDLTSVYRWAFSQELRHQLTNELGAYRPSVYGVRSDTQNWNIRYADGSFASGDVYHDVVGVGGTFVFEQAVEVATNASDELVNNAAVDGILGLGFNNLNKGMYISIQCLEA